MKMTTEARAVVEVDNFERVRALTSQPERFTAKLRASMEAVGTELALAILAELNRRECAA